MIVTATLRQHRARASLALALAMAAAGSASALEVTQPGDSGVGSLRAVVAAGGNVTFSPALNGAVIQLTSGPITVPPGTTINGPGANLVGVSGSLSSRIFDVGPGPSVTITGLRLVDGHAGAGQGGAIRNLGSLVVNGLAVTGNRAGDAGGGIYNAGTLDVRASTFSGNAVIDPTCAGGGAIRSEGPGSVLLVADSTISGNSASACSGGGISFNDGSASIRASTIANNSAGSSGGNLYKGSAAASLQLTGSIVTEGAAGGGTPANADLHGALGGGLASGGHNLVRQRGDAVGFAASDLAAGTDPQLAALAGNGGATQTHAFATTSPALDAWATGCVQPADQRGFARPQGDACDIGAFEYRQNRLAITAVGGGSVSAGAAPVPLQGTIANCSTACAAEYDGEVAPSVTLVATPGAGRLFSGWSGDCTGNSPTTAVTMDQARSCTAAFMPDTVVVTPVAGPNGSLAPATPQTVTYGSTIAFTVTPAANHHIASVTGCGGTLAGNLFTTAPLTANCTVNATFAIDTHLVTATAGANGTISPLQQTVDHGQVALLTLAPAANHHVASVTGCGGTLAGNIYTTAPVTADCAVSATFAIDTHVVTASAGANGSISPPSQSVEHGAVASLTVTPAANHHIDSVTGCGGSLVGNTYTTGPVTADCSVSATFAIDRHTVTATAGANGSIAPPTQQVDHGQVATLTVTPDANHHIASVSGCGGSLAGNTYTTGPVTSDCAVTAAFSIDTHTVTGTAGANGNITPASQEIEHGEVATLTVTPAANHHIDTVTGCGGTLAGNTYTTGPVTADCSVTASFAIDTHAVTATAGPNGSIAPATQDVDHGEVATLTLTPDANYHVDTVTGCGGTLAGTTYTTAPVTAACEVVATFAIDVHTVTATAGPNGSITPATQDVDHGEVATLTVAAAAHHHVDSVEGCGGTLAGDTYTTAPVTADCEVQASFAIDTHAIGGTVTGLSGTGLVLRLNGGENLQVAANGAFQFATPVPSQAPYVVTIAQQPSAPAQICSIANGSGTVGDADVTDVLVSCVDALPDLALDVDNEREYVRYGRVVDYVVTLHNSGNGDSRVLTLAGIASAAVDSAFTRWHCFGAGAGATCAPSGRGPLLDANVRVPAGRTLTWIVSAPVRFYASQGSVDYSVTASGTAGTAGGSDTDPLVLMRSGFDVVGDDGARSRDEMACGASVRSGFDPSATHALPWPVAPARRAVEPILDARDAAGAGFRIDRLAVDEQPRTRVVAIGAGGTELAGDWALVVSPTLALGTVRSPDAGQVLLVEGTEPALAQPLPDTTGVMLRPLSSDPADCE
ncbi:MAG: hypothetical protein EOP90_12180 [Lysobacteraceae bacterium]|nr:MAG: hypothetical protein EOP90_12180 [Xanthomonadaceae bacterium]